MAFLEKVTLAPSQLDASELANVRRSGVSDRAILDATYVCVGFNIITRIADALGFKVPAEELFVRAAKLLRVFGYRRLSGFWISESSKENCLHDPYASKMERLRHAVLAGPGSLSPHVRQTISQGGRLPSALEVFVQKLTCAASTLTDDDIAELHRAHYTDDQIFEAIVSAAVGAGLFRLDCVLSLLRSNHTEASSEAATAITSLAC